MLRRGMLALLALLALSVAATGCGGGAASNPKADQTFLNSVYGQAPDIQSYRTGPQLLRLGQAVCGDLRAGASMEQVADRLPLVEGSVALPPGDLGVVISVAVTVLCPAFAKVIGR